MRIIKIGVKNFRMLTDAILEMRRDLSLLIGRNNSGKTSFLVLFERFYEPSIKFTFDDFPIGFRKQILAIQYGGKVDNLAIQMTLEIEFNGEDDLRQISDFILDLDDGNNIVKILFECSIDAERLVRDLELVTSCKERYIKKNLYKYLVNRVYAFLEDEDVTKNRQALVQKDISLVRALINFEIIHARRDVASSEGGKKILSKLTTQYFNKANDDQEHFDPINELLIGMDEGLEKKYEEFFNPFLAGAKKFLAIDNIKVVSNLESKEVLDNCSQVVYGGDGSFLPETYNGLGHMNILYLLLAIEIRKESFNKSKCQINLLFIEEPEAHTHPQIQYVFSTKIKSILSEIDNLQTVITTHSSHIVSQCNFEDIRYFKVSNGEVEIKNFYSELERKYGRDTDSFNFITQYLTLSACELFFASKVVFIEGLTERVLWDYFVSRFDELHGADELKVPLSSQNITILEAGANAKSFKHFIEFIGIKALIITDIDTTIYKEGEGGRKGGYVACCVSEGTHTSNATIRHYLNSPDFTEVEKFQAWFEDLKNHSLQVADFSPFIAYQKTENGYHGRSFEDAFVNINLDLIKNNIEHLQGLKNVDLINDVGTPYELVDKVLEKKSAFASSLLFLALASETVQWKTPLYIEEGIKWLAK
ncbi:Predicted ATP-dependent endonuclease of the OLD family, contains P-loop ATPase and TOPRIM domains [Pseudomonas sp. NFACC32-1]|uniref:ATP-dependent nuclease n=1 Tax=Pseudomonas sp. NFACC32-1 TaxID=1566198 RepID=UPI00087610CE|nr:ATP-dependent endonuclease [Pseudomonas sp. NFACC32-1]SCX55904.1 Predicted ATP-dependent endonuclease of the OLD family, contains P-loop ATPase and TOPRIM domains [Pseudomonas sp. NFACC32-1]